MPSLLPDILVEYINLYQMNGEPMGGKRLGREKLWLKFAAILNSGYEKGSLLYFINSQLRLLRSHN